MIVGPIYLASGSQDESSKSWPVRLELVMNENFPYYIEGRRRTPYVQELNSFQVLGKARLDCFSLCEDIVAEEIKNQREDLEAVTSSERDSQMRMTRGRRAKEIRMRHLVDTMPSSIEEVALVSYLSKKEIKALLNGIPKCKEKAVPRLREVVLEHAALTDEKMRAACQKVGVSIKAVYSPGRRIERISAAMAVAQMTDPYC